VLIPYRMPRLIEKFYPELIFRLPGNEKTVYLTFDDGPSEKVTTFVLNQLEKYHAVATFFLIGDKLNQHEGLVKRLISQGHRIGNHTYHHLNAWRTDPDTYWKNVQKTQAKLGKFSPAESPLFRPPYGKIRKKNIKRLHQNGFRIIMWSLLSFDFDPAYDPEKSLKKLKQSVRPGDIVVFHDSPKAFPSLQKILPPFLDFLFAEGYETRTL